MDNVTAVARADTDNTETMHEPGMGTTGRLVWDLPLRLFHWSLVAAIGLLWLTHYLGYEHLTELPARFNLDWMTIHMWLGYWTLSLVIFRVLWGFIGPRHSRFASFFPLPGRIRSYLKGVAKPVGHNPLGAFMVFLMLGLVGAQATTGLFATDDIITFGPLNEVTWLSPATTAWFNSLHHRLFDYILIAIAVHVLAITIYTLALKQNLLRPMLHGRKPESRVPTTEAIASSQVLRAVMAVAIASAIVYGILCLAPPPAQTSLY